jgi:hypothetical protein
MPKVGQATTNEPIAPNVKFRQYNSLHVGRLGDLLSFIHERHEIYRRRQRGEPKPWTTDPILRDYKFTNIYRGLDRTTIWIKENWIDKHADDPNLYFAMAVARHVNLPATMAELGYPSPWNRDKFLKVSADRAARGEPVFSRAYSIHQGPTKGVSKPQYLAAEILGPMWEHRDFIRKYMRGSLQLAHSTLMRCNGIGSFMAGQIVADLKQVAPLKNAPDFWSFACPGPGSKRGLAYVRDCDPNASCSDERWQWAFRQLFEAMTPLITMVKLPRICGQNMQSCLCEFSKYERFRLGGTAPKAKFSGKGV